MSASGRVSVGHPVDVASGVLFNTWLDFAIPGTLPLVFERFYSTALITQTAEAPLGPGWRHGFQHELRQTLEGFAYLDPQGVEHPLEDSKGSFDTCGKLLSPAHQMELRGTRDDLELQHYGGPHPQWVLHFRRRPKSTRYRLETLGLSPQARLRFEYSSTGPLKRVIHARSGRALRLESTPQGRRGAALEQAAPQASHRLCLHLGPRLCGRNLRRRRPSCLRSATGVTHAGDVVPQLCGCRGPCHHPVGDVAAQGPGAARSPVERTRPLRTALHRPLGAGRWRLGIGPRPTPPPRQAAASPGLDELRLPLVRPLRRLRPLGAHGAAPHPGPSRLRLHLHDRRRQGAGARAPHPARTASLHLPVVPAGSAAPSCLRHHRRDACLDIPASPLPHAQRARGGATRPPDAGMAQGPQGSCPAEGCSEQGPLGGPPT
ncbi:DUF6531 domain-containing protein [Myxococcus sp. AS-1-15]|nr:DUF6531 domain-containing protein [Myxococcus sp. AS-1-15]